MLHFTSFLIFQILPYFTMDTFHLNQQDSIIHRQIYTTLDQLTLYFQQLTSPDLIQHCLLWQHEKGTKKLINLAIQGDKFLIRQSKSLKKIHATQRSEKQKQDIRNEKERRSEKKRLKELIFEQDNIEIRIENQVNQKIDEPSKEKQQQKIEQNNKKNQISGKSNTQLKESRNYHEAEVNVKKQGDLSIDDQLRLEPDSIFYSDEADEDKFVENIDRLKIDVKKPKRYLRGPYKNYSRQMKQKMVELYKSNTYSISRISSEYGVPIKNIKRWAQNGVDRKQGAGRKRLDPTMEDDLFNKIQINYPPDSQIEAEEIRTLALNLSKYSDFKASKGWVMSFIERYNLNKIYRIM